MLQWGKSGYVPVNRIWGGPWGTLLRLRKKRRLIYLISEFLNLPVNIGMNRLRKTVTGWRLGNHAIQNQQRRPRPYLITLVKNCIKNWECRWVSFNGPLPGHRLKDGCPGISNPQIPVQLPIKNCSTMDLIVCLPVARPSKKHWPITKKN